MLKVVTCQCGSADSLVRTRLGVYRYKDALTIPIVKGKSRAKSELNSIPQFEQIKTLREYIENVSKFAVVIGYDNEMCRWVDLANGKAVYNNIELENILGRFA